MEEEKEIERESLALIQSVQNKDLKGFKAILKRGKANLYHTIEMDWLNYEDIIARRERSAFIYACGKGYVDFVKLFINANINIDFPLKAGASAMYIACQEGQKEVVKTLLNSKVNINLRCDDGYTYLHIASHNGHAEVVKILLDAKINIEVQDEDGVTALHSASENGRVEAVKVLLNSKAKIDVQNNEGLTAIHVASVNGHTEVVRLLLECKANFQLTCNSGWNPLMMSSSLGYLEIVKLLVRARINLNAQSNDGFTALILSAYNNQLEVTTFLLEEGAAYSFKDRWGKTAEDFAVLRGWNWRRMIAEANLKFFDHVFDCMVNADYLPIVEKKRGRKRKRGEKEVEKIEELPFLLKFMKKVINSDFIMSKNVFPKLSFNPGAESGEGMQFDVFEEEDEEVEEDDLI